MHKIQEPVPNAWYTNLTGQLFKVRMLSYGQDGLTSIVIEYLEGAQQIINRQEWVCLKLMKHTISTNKTSTNSMGKVTK